MWAQIKLYKWMILIVVISGLIMFSGYQYYRADKLATQNTELSGKVDTLEGSLQGIKESIDTANKNLEDLRVDNKKITDETNVLKNRLDTLPGTPKAPAPPRDAAGNIDTKQLQNQVNTFSNDIFKRLENVSKGKFDE